MKRGKRGRPEACLYNGDLQTAKQHKERFASFNQCLQLEAPLHRISFKAGSGIAVVPVETNKAVIKQPRSALQFGPTMLRKPLMRKRRSCRSCAKVGRKEA